MKDNVEIYPDLMDGIRQYSSIEQKLVAIKTKLSSIESDLSNDSQWDGDRRDKCKKINGLIQQYLQAIPPFCEELEESLRDLLRNAETFDGDSTSLAAIKNW